MFSHMFVCQSVQLWGVGTHVNFAHDALGHSIVVYKSIMGWVTWDPLKVVVEEDPPQEVVVEEAPQKWWWKRTPRRSGGGRGPPLEVVVEEDPPPPKARTRPDQLRSTAGQAGSMP